VGSRPIDGHLVAVVAPVARRGVWIAAVSG